MDTTQPDKNKGEHLPESRDVFHDDENLQDEQAEFDAANAEVDVKKAIDQLSRLEEARKATKNHPNKSIGDQQ
jgi:hypothetical protein